MSSIDLSEETLEEYDLVIIVTDHDEFDYDLILKIAKCVVDTRGRFRHNKMAVRA